MKELNYMKNGSLAYKDQKFYFFDDSNGFKEQDVIMSLNLPIMVTLKFVHFFRFPQVLSTFSCFSKIYSLYFFSKNVVFSLFSSYFKSFLPFLFRNIQKISFFV